MEFCRLAALEGENVSELCQRHGISRQTGYVWPRRLQPVGGTAPVGRIPLTVHGSRSRACGCRISGPSRRRRRRASALDHPARFGPTACFNLTRKACQVPEQTKRPEGATLPAFILKPEPIRRLRWYGPCGPLRPSGCRWRAAERRSGRCCG
ncbi:helix-turn-helix domain-containing protein [Rhizobium leguminosarum]|uniref:Helix-turn-helix domain-containing protein n=1 Tax=Rhizobium beringeri TaxID=3019934 RepID=A0ABY1Y0S5_9HYPH|nr:hypothetical protein [Rhizobium leguminosarum bv. viciae]RWX17843.1 helix-turn-helix domain-containing protein [Rhizobium leguminosarum]TBE73092.1 helix-turn-helix domain-containing protein [Rhizobium beringeri]TAU55243.1 helix-turn-helix domain-containing protein [Rhizobium leguminosarum]TBC75214.1 helix-turn-helix domain-containing protein [Rhizobium leguminosarum]